jgi:hypothetical protein
MTYLILLISNTFLPHFIDRCTIRESGIISNNLVKDDAKDTIFKTI